MAKEKVEDNSKIGAWANGLRIVCNILKVLTVIGIVCLTIVLVFMPKIMKGVKIDEEKIVLYDQKIEYTFKDVDFLVYRINDGKEKKVNTKDIYKYLDLSAISNTDINKIRNIIMVDLLFVIVICIMEFMVLNLLSGLLKRTKDEGVAFVEGGHKVLTSVMWILIAEYVVKVIISVCTAIAIPVSGKIESSTSIDLSFVVMLCVIYFVSLLYKRGEQLQNK